MESTHQNRREDRDECKMDVFKVQKFSQHK